MATREVNQAGWREFCERVQQTCRGAMLNIEVQQADGTTCTVAEGLPLRGFVLDEKSDACNTQLIIEAGQDKPIRHVVVEPIHLRLKHDGNGDRYSVLQMVAENGTTTALFRPGLSPDLLNGLDVQ